MLDFHSILWVIPGAIFIYFYNKFRPSNAKAMAIDLSGWSLIFCVVVIAVPTWLVAELIIEKYFNFDNQIKELAKLGLSVFFTFILLFAVQMELIAKMVFLSVKDNFYNRCVQWENKETFLTLKNGKVYRGMLWKFPDSPKLRHESQTISIVPLESGYRTHETKQVVWDTFYPVYYSYEELVDMEVIIPRAEIITFGKFNYKTFKHFFKQES